MANKEILDFIGKGTPTLAKLTREMAMGADKASRVCHAISLVAIIISIILNLLALILTIPALWILGTTFLLVSICFYFESEIDRVRWIALEAHADQIGLLNILAGLAKTSIKKEKTHGEPRPKGVKRTGRRVHE